MVIVGNGVIQVNEVGWVMLDFAIIEVPKELVPVSDVSLVTRGESNT